NENNNGIKGKSISEEVEKTYYSDFYTTPPPQAGLINRYTSTPSCSVLIESPEIPARVGNNIFSENYYDNDRVIIDDVENLYFKDGDPANDYKINEFNVSQMFRKYQNESVRMSKNGGLVIESNVHEILSLSSIFLLSPNSYSKQMVNVFGTRFLDEIRQNIIPTQEMTLNLECELKFREAIKKSTKESREHAKEWLLNELTNDQNLEKNLGSVILKGLETLPNDKIRNDPSEITLITNYLDYVMRSIFHDPEKHVVQWPNTGLNESKLRKFNGRAKQPDFTVSVIHQLQTAATIFVGEVSPPSQKYNVYKNCSDLIRLGVFMKDCIDSAIDKGADVKIIGFQCVDFIIDFYMIDLVKGTYFMIHISQVSIPASIKELLFF
ncbi:3447_t:CDS:2, partial [Scutellospora calospora]